MRWAIDMRLRYIESLLISRGKFNRGDIVDRFGVSLAQASVDIGKYGEINGDGFYYDASKKRYCRSDVFSPVFNGSCRSVVEYVADLDANCSEHVDECAIMKVLYRMYVLRHRANKVLIVLSKNIPGLFGVNGSVGAFYIDRELRPVYIGAIWSYDFRTLAPSGISVDDGVELLAAMADIISGKKTEWMLVLDRCVSACGPAREAVMAEVMGIKFFA
jgi:hypothetical protein